jgi:hypothetical protein
LCHDIFLLDKISVYPYAKKCQIYKGMGILLDNTFLSTLIQTKVRLFLVVLFRQQYWNKIIDFDALLLAGGKTSVRVSGRLL